MKINLTLYLGISLVLICNIASGQIYPAAGGSFVVFNKQIRKNSDVTLTCANEIKRYQWPSGTQDFIRAYRNAASILKAPLTLTDDDLSKIFAALEENKELKHHIFYSPALLLALGQAAYIPGNTPSLCEFTMHEDTKTKSLSVIDQRILSRDSSVVKKSESKMVSNRLQIIFPPNSWIDSARVYKKSCA